MNKMKVIRYALIFSKGSGNVVIFYFSGRYIAKRFVLLSGMVTPAVRSTRSYYLSGDFQGLLQ